MKLTAMMLVATYAAAQTPPPPPPPTGLALTDANAKIAFGPNAECVFEYKAGSPPYLESSCPVVSPPPPPPSPPADPPSAPPSCTYSQYRLYFPPSSWAGLAESSCVLEELDFIDLAGNEVPIAAPVTKNAVPGCIEAGSSRAGIDCRNAFNQPLSCTDGSVCGDPTNREYHGGGATDSNGYRYVGFNFGTPTTIAQYAVRSSARYGGNQTPYTWTFQGSNDGTTWTDIHSVTSHGLNAGEGIQLISPAACDN